MYFKDEYLIVMETGSNDDQFALAWCQMLNGTMFLSEKRLYFRQDDKKITDQKLIYLLIQSSKTVLS